ncbi:MAG: 50S ribosomal protein L22 [Bacteroidetes bacterium]|nr:50S ribosomal protein L22 [Bacteroidota bacterium]MCW5896400.1 50S ribosomal protein L22 [Bacteroidota bacterium]
MEARAINRYIGTSPRKMRLVIDLIRGKSVDQALHILHFSPKHAARTAEKVLRSAVSNLQNKDEGGRLETSDMVVKEAFVDGGMTMKRISPAPMGRAYRIRKRSNHVTIVVQGEKHAAKPAAKPKATKAKTATPEPASAEAKPKKTKKTEPAAEKPKTRTKKASSKEKDKE